MRVDLVADLTAVEGLHGAHADLFELAAAEEEVAAQAVGQQGGGVSEQACRGYLVKGEADVRVERRGKQKEPLVAGRLLADGVHVHGPPPDLRDKITEDNTGNSMTLGCLLFQRGMILLTHTTRVPCRGMAFEIRSPL